jgi:hypothetical protein
MARVLSLDTFFRTRCKNHKTPIRVGGYRLTLEGLPTLTRKGLVDHAEKLVGDTKISPPKTEVIGEYLTATPQRYGGR